MILTCLLPFNSLASLICAAPVKNLGETSSGSASHSHVASNPFKFPSADKLETMNHADDLKHVDVGDYKDMAHMIPRTISAQLDNMTKNLENKRNEHVHTETIPYLPFLDVPHAPKKIVTHVPKESSSHPYWHAVQAMEEIRPHAKAAHEMLKKDGHTTHSDRIAESIKRIDSHPHKNNAVSWIEDDKKAKAE
jgi:hypothetical protein